MKKTALLGICGVLAGCVNSTPPVNYCQMNKAPEPEFVNVVAPSPCECNVCSSVAPQPEVLKPRITETVSKTTYRRCCPNEALSASVDSETVIPDMPEIYVIAANRAVTSLIADTQAIFSTRPVVRIYVRPTMVGAEDLPKGLEKGVETLQKRLSTAGNILVVDNEQSAELVLSTLANWFDTPSKKVPAIRYDLSLDSTFGDKIGFWSSIVHQASGDKSWW